MRNLTVKKDNALVGASYSFTTTEQRLILMAIARGQNNISSLHKITAMEFAETYKITPETAYEGLKEAAKQLFERRFSWIEKTEKGNTKHVQARWISRTAYVDGEGFIEFRFSEDVLPLLAELKERFTIYNLNHITHLTSFYAIRLYELIIAWRSTNKTPVFELESFREQLGISPNEYPRMTNFKQRVLDIALKQINEHTDITAQYEQHKRGRSISGFSFTFTQKKPRSKPKGRRTMTKAEAQKDARPGEEWNELYKRLSRDFTITD